MKRCLHRQTEVIKWPNLIYDLPTTISIFLLCSCHVHTSVLRLSNHKPFLDPPLQAKTSHHTARPTSSLVPTQSLQLTWTNYSRLVPGQLSNIPASLKKKNIIRSYIHVFWWKSCKVYKVSLLLCWHKNIAESHNYRLVVNSTFF